MAVRTGRAVDPQKRLARLRQVREQERAIAVATRLSYREALRGHEEHLAASQTSLVETISMPLPDALRHASDALGTAHSAAATQREELRHQATDSAAAWQDSIERAEIRRAGALYDIHAEGVARETAQKAITLRRERVTRTEAARSASAVEYARSLEAHRITTERDAAMAAAKRASKPHAMVSRGQTQVDFASTRLHGAAEIASRTTRSVGGHVTVQRHAAVVRGKDGSTLDFTEGPTAAELANAEKQKRAAIHQRELRERAETNRLSALRGQQAIAKVKLEDADAQMRKELEVLEMSNRAYKIARIVPPAKETHTLWSVPPARTSSNRTTSRTFAQAVGQETLLAHQSEQRCRERALSSSLGATAAYDADFIHNAPRECSTPHDKWGNQFQRPASSAPPSTLAHPFALYASNAAHNTSPLEAPRPIGHRSERTSSPVAPFARECFPATCQSSEVQEHTVDSATQAAYTNQRWAEPVQLGPSHRPAPTHASPLSPHHEYSDGSPEMNVSDSLASAFMESIEKGYTRKSVVTADTCRGAHISNLARAQMDQYAGSLVVDQNSRSAAISNSGSEGPEVQLQHQPHVCEKPLPPSDDHRLETAASSGKANAVESLHPPLTGPSMEHARCEVGPSHVLQFLPHESQATCRTRDSAEPTRAAGGAAGSGLADEEAGPRPSVPMPMFDGMEPTSHEFSSRIPIDRQAAFVARLEASMGASCGARNRHTIPEAWTDTALMGRMESTDKSSNGVQMVNLLTTSHSSNTDLGEHSREDSEGWVPAGETGAVRQEDNHVSSAAGLIEPKGQRQASSVKRVVVRRKERAVPTTRPVAAPRSLTREDRPPSTSRSPKIRGAGGTPTQFHTRRASPSKSPSRKSDGHATTGRQPPRQAGERSGAHPARAVSERTQPQQGSISASSRSRTKLTAITRTRVPRDLECVEHDDDVGPEEELQPWPRAPSELSSPEDRHSSEEVEELGALASCTVDQIASRSSRCPTELEPLSRSQLAAIRSATIPVSVPRVTIRSRRAVAERASDAAPAALARARAAAAATIHKEDGRSAAGNAGQHVCSPSDQSTPDGEEAQVSNIGQGSFASKAGQQPDNSSPTSELLQLQDGVGSSASQQRGARRWSRELSPPSDQLSSSSSDVSPLAPRSTKSGRVRNMTSEVQRHHRGHVRETNSGDRGQLTSRHGQVETSNMSPLSLLSDPEDALAPRPYVPEAFQESTLRASTWRAPHRIASLGGGHGDTHLSPFTSSSDDDDDALGVDAHRRLSTFSASGATSISSSPDLDVRGMDVAKYERPRASPTTRSCPNTRSSASTSSLVPLESRQERQTSSSRIANTLSEPSQSDSSVTGPFSAAEDRRPSHRIDPHTSSARTSAACGRGLHAAPMPFESQPFPMLPSVSDESFNSDMPVGKRYFDESSSAADDYNGELDGELARILSRSDGVEGVFASEREHTEDFVHWEDDPMRPLSPDTAALLGLPPGCGMLEAIERLSSAPSDGLSSLDLPVDLMHHAVSLGDFKFVSSGAPSSEEETMRTPLSAAYSTSLERQSSALQDFGVGLQVAGDQISTAAAVAMAETEVDGDTRPQIVSSSLMEPTTNDTDRAQLALPSCLENVGVTTTTSEAGYVSLASNIQFGAE